MGIPGTIKLSSTLASEMGTLGGTENHPEKCRVKQEHEYAYPPSSRSHGAGFRPEEIQLWVCTHILCGPCHHSGTFLTFSVRSRGPLSATPTFWHDEATPLRLPPRPRPGAPRLRPPGLRKRLSGCRDVIVTSSARLWSGSQCSRGRGRAWPPSPGVLLLLFRCRYPLGLHHVPQQQPEAALDLCGRGAAGAPAGRRQPQIQVQSGG